MKFWKFIKKVIKNEDNIFESENAKFKELGTYAIVFLITFFSVLRPEGRWFIKWLVYIVTGGISIMAIAMFLCNVIELLKSFKHFMKLEKAGTSVEEVELARRHVCEVEGDDALPMQES